MKEVSEAEAYQNFRTAFFSRIVEDCKSAGGYHAELEAWRFVFPQTPEGVEHLQLLCHWAGIEVEAFQRRMRKLKDGPTIAPTHQRHQPRRNLLRRSVAA